MDEAEKRKRRVCFTGHRPEKLIESEEYIKDRLRQEILRSIDEGYSVFISGMARGFDIWAAEIVLQMRSEGYEIKLICALPYNGFEERWSSDWQKRYRQILSQADFVRCVSKRYAPDCFQNRNEWMVNHSAKVIAVYNGTKGGTKNTIEYANLCKRVVVVLN